jgi:glycosyltransferase involved in cell wall biosynthesis
MKVAIVAPSSVPFTIGGAENLYWGLQAAINQESPHQCELIKLPSPELGFWDLIDSYRTFDQIDLSHFDRIISTKYPSWMVSHRDHACYMLHTLRGLYDTYPVGLPDTEGSSAARRLMSWMADLPVPTREDARALLAQLHELKDAGETPGFPGPFARAVVRFLDGMALAPGRISRHAAISRTVAARDGYFPADADVRVLYPPPMASGFRCGGDDYLFTVSRLDGPKRIALLVEAMRHVRSDVPLLIAGTGPEEERLRALAGDDPRIRFLGFVNDRDVVNLYADALAVPFVPFQEDYGLITIEAMMSGKPVLTVKDAGGPLEFVRDGETGFVTPPDPAALAMRIDHLCDHRDEARLMGARACELVRPITWAPVIEGLLGETRQSVRRPVRRPRRPRMAVTTTFPVHPPRGGGQVRLFHLYRNLARAADIEVVTLGAPDSPPFEAEIAPGVVEVRVPRSAAHAAAEADLERSVGRTALGDIATILFADLTPDYGAAIARAASDAACVVASHPYMARTIAASAPGRPLWYEAQDVELDLKTPALGDSATGRDLLQRVAEVEAHCWTTSELVFACARRDLVRLGELFGPTKALQLEVPNGVATDELPFVDRARRAEIKSALGLDHGLALFVGSWHPPNIEAAEKILRLAPDLPDIVFVIAGSVGLALSKHLVPANVMILGELDDATIQLLLSAADVGLNPMETGSGTNLKVLTYFAAGTPLISTPFGVRGIAIEPDVHCRIVGLDGFSQAIRSAIHEADGTDRQARAARDLVEDRYSWTRIARDLETAMWPVLSGLNRAGISGGPNS